MSPHPLPERFTLQHENEALVVSWPWKRTSLWQLLIFLFCCPAPCGLYGQSLVEGTVALERNGSPDGYVKIPWFGYILVAGAILFIATFLFSALLSWVNHSTLRAEPGSLRVRHGPIPLPGTELRASDIVRFEPETSSRVARERNSDTGAPFLSSSPSANPSKVGPDDEYRLYAITRDGKRHRVLSALETLAQCTWVERELKHALGMREQAKRG
jgi:hypothetical protein